MNKTQRDLYFLISDCSYSLKTRALGKYQDMVISAIDNFLNNGGDFYFTCAIDTTLAYEAGRKNMHRVKDYLINRGCPIRFSKEDFDRIEKNKQEEKGQQ